MKFFLHFILSFYSLFLFGQSMEIQGKVITHQHPSISNVSFLPELDESIHETGYEISLPNGSRYISNGAEWEMSKDSTGSNSALTDNRTLTGTGVSGDEIRNAFVIPYETSVLGGDVAIENTTATNNDKIITTGGNYENGSLRFGRAMGSGFLRLVPDSGETYTIEETNQIVIPPGQTAILEYEASTNNWNLVGGSLIGDRVPEKINPAVTLTNSGTSTNYNTQTFTIINEWDDGTPVINDGGYNLSNSFIRSFELGQHRYRIDANINFSSPTPGVQLELQVFINNISTGTSFYTQATTATMQNINCSVWALADLSFFKNIDIRVRQVGAAGTATSSNANSSIFTVMQVRKKT